MSIYDEMDNIPETKKLSDLPDTIIATVLSAEKTLKKGQNAGTPQFSLRLKLNDGTEITTSYRIPKAKGTGGQMDQLDEALAKLKITKRDLVGKTFEWKRQELTAAIKGNARHYPTKIYKK